jgi:hypothetical protein
MWGDVYAGGRTGSLYPVGQPNRHRPKQFRAVGRSSSTQATSITLGKSLWMPTWLRVHRTFVLTPLATPPGADLHGCEGVSGSCSDTARRDAAAVSVPFANVTASGVTFRDHKHPRSAPPDGFELGSPPVYYDLSTTATFNGSAAVCFAWIEGQYPNENAFRLWRLESRVGNGCNYVRR